MREFLLSEKIAREDKLNLTDFVYNMYEMYHQEAIENAYKDIDELIKKSNLT